MSNWTVHVHGKLFCSSFDRLFLHRKLPKPISLIQPIIYNKFGNFHQIFNIIVGCIFHQLIFFDGVIHGHFVHGVEVIGAEFEIKSNSFVLEVENEHDPDEKDGHEVKDKCNAYGLEDEDRTCAIKRRRTIKSNL